MFLINKLIITVSAIYALFVLSWWISYISTGYKFLFVRNEIWSAILLVLTFCFLLFLVSSKSPFPKKARKILHLSIPLILPFAGYLMMCSIQSQNICGGDVLYAFSMELIPILAIGFGAGFSMTIIRVYKKFLKLYGFIWLVAYLTVVCLYF